MSQTYKELLQQREALEKAIAQARQNEIAAAVTQVRALVAEFGLTAQDIFPGRATKTSSKPPPRWHPNTVTPPRARPGRVAAKPPNGSTARTATSS